MSYLIEYSVLCNTGLVREKNQDNFWCMGKFLQIENDGLHETITGTADIKDNPAFAIFDGMGGEQHGEVAAFIAADSFSAAYGEISNNNDELFLIDACRNMNNAVCTYIKKQQIQSSGSTVAILLFSKKGIYICNIGDSRVYQFSDNDMTQISHDHTESGIKEGKSPLTQCLGINETEFIIEPYIAKGAYKNRDKYLICSDGLSDMVSEEEIVRIISEGGNHTKSAETLMQRALDLGGKDNITIILCEIRKQVLNKLRNFMGGVP